MQKKETLEQAKKYLREADSYCNPLSEGVIIYQNKAIITMLKYLIETQKSTTKPKASGHNKD